ncbi:MAG: DUF5050 domain-containing protein [Dehalobacterium sp.]
MKLLKKKNHLQSMAITVLFFLLALSMQLSISLADSAPIIMENREFITQSDDWIYFSSTSDNGRLYKMKTDSSNRTKLSDDSIESMVMQNDWIFYIANGNIYKISKDGKDRSVIYSKHDVIPHKLIIKYDKMFFQDDEFGLYQMDLDGKELRNIINVENISSWTILDHVIYYSVPEKFDDNGNAIKSPIYRVTLEGYGNTLKIGEKSKLTDDGGNYINVIWFNDGQDRIYYSNISDKGRLYMIKADGTGKTKLTDHTVSNIRVGGFWVYYSNDSDESKLYRISIVGTLNTRLINAYTKYINVYSNNIYYLSDSNSSKIDKLYRIKTDLSGRIELK